MNHYEIIGVPNTASLSEIKSAFRKKVKLAHPDLNPGKDQQEFIRLNEAYEVLSESSTRSLYDQYLEGVPLVTVIEEVSPQARYKAQYVRDRIRKQRERIAYEIAIKQKFYVFLRGLNMVALLLAIILSYDFYFPSSTESFLPTKVIMGRDNTALHWGTAQSVLVDLDFFAAYHRSESKEVQLSYSGLLGVPIRVSLDSLEEPLFVSGNLYVFRNGYSVIMFFFSLMVVGNRKYSDFRLTCGLVSSFVLLWIVLLLGDYL